MAEFWHPTGDPLVGRTAGRWYADPVTGALLDLLDFGLLSIAVSVLVRRRRPAAVVVPGALMLGGWGSNLLDGAGVIVVVALGAAYYGGMTTASAHVSANGDRHARTTVAAYRSGACDRLGASAGTAPRADLDYVLAPAA